MLENIINCLIFVIYAINLFLMKHLLNTDYDLVKKDLKMNPISAGMDGELWKLFRSGDRMAFNTIFEKNVRILYAYGRNFTSDKEFISDCIQDIFIELWIRREMVTAKVNSVKYYLIKAVRRRILRRLSEEKRLKGQPISENYCEAMEFNIEYSLIEEQLVEDRSHQLKASVANLSKGQQEAIYLRFYEDMTYEEVASVMKTNVKSVYNLIGRSILSLRKFFKAHPISH